jgi:putative acetyltransferase
LQVKRKEDVDYFFWEQGVGSKRLEFAKEKLGVRFLWALEKN